MSNGMTSIVLTLSKEKAFDESGRKLLDLIGASAMLYAAVAYFVFDDSFFAEDLIENYGDNASDIVAWLEHLYATCETMITGLRVYYETTDKLEPAGTGQNTNSYKLIRVTFSPEDEYIFIRASKNQSHDILGSGWGVPDDSPKGMSSDWTHLGADVRISSF
ncbi:hypothetical protein D3C85_14230 [compost metagenome]